MINMWQQHVINSTRIENCHSIAKTNKMRYFKTKVNLTWAFLSMFCFQNRHLSTCYRKQKHEIFSFRFCGLFYVHSEIEEPFHSGNSTFWPLTEREKIFQKLSPIIISFDISQTERSVSSVDTIRLRHTCLKGKKSLLASSRVEHSMLVIRMRI